MKKFFPFLIVILLSFSACKNTTKSSSNALKMNHKKIETLIRKNKFQFDYFVCKARVNFNQQNFTANFRIKKDSIIWISFTGPFGIEGARALITASQFELIDKINKTYYKKPLSFVENYIPIKADFDLIENLIVGNFLEKKIKKQKIETKDNRYYFEGNLSELKTSYILNPNGKYHQLSVNDVKNQTAVNIKFDKYEKLDNQDFALKRLFLITQKDKNYNLDLKFYKHSKQKVDFPFVVPTNYRTIE